MLSFIISILSFAFIHICTSHICVGKNKVFERTSIIYEESFKLSLFHFFLSSIPLTPPFHHFPMHLHCHYLSYYYSHSVTVYVMLVMGLLIFRQLQ